MCGRIPRMKGVGCIGNLSAAAAALAQDVQDNELVREVERLGGIHDAHSMDGVWGDARARLLSFVLCGASPLRG
jgi:hypothetical protein